MKKAFVGLPELTDIEDTNQEEPEEDGFLTTSQTEIEGLSEEESTVISWHGCVAHLLQLVVQDGLKAGAVYIRYSNTISKCKKIAGLGKWSVQFSWKLSKRIMQATVMRWNSFFAMVTSILDQQEKISQALVECRKEDLKLNDNEIHLVRNLTKLLKYFREATDILQVGQTYAIHKVIPVCQMLSKAVASIDFTEDACCNHIRGTSLNPLEKRFEYVKSSPKHIFARLCDPTKKLNITGSNNRFFNFNQEFRL